MKTIYPSSRKKPHWPPEMLERPPVYEPSGQRFLKLISDQMFVVSVPVFDTQRPRIALLLPFMVESAQRKILSHSVNTQETRSRSSNSIFFPLFCSAFSQFYLYKEIFSATFNNKQRTD